MPVGTVAVAARCAWPARSTASRREDRRPTNGVAATPISRRRVDMGGGVPSHSLGAQSCAYNFYRD